MDEQNFSPFNWFLSSIRVAAQKQKVKKIGAKNFNFLKIDDRQMKIKKKKDLKQKKRVDN